MIEIFFRGMKFELCAHIFKVHPNCKCLNNTIEQFGLIKKKKPRMN